MYRNREENLGWCPANSATMLHVAACYNLHSTCRILLEKGAETEVEDDIGNRAIHYAARWGDHHIGTMLLDAGTSVIKTNKSGVSPLEEASLFGNADLVRLLLQHGAKVSEVALKNAVQRESVACVELLLQHGAQIDMTGLGHGNALSLAIRTGNFQVIRILMDHYREDTNTNVLNELLNAAAGEHSTAVVKLILDRGAAADAQAGWLGSPLLEAVLVDEIETVRLLLKHGADVHTTGHRQWGNALGLAKSSKIWNLLFQHGAAPPLPYLAASGTTPPPNLVHGRKLNKAPNGGFGASVDLVYRFDTQPVETVNWNTENADGSTNISRLPLRRRKSV